MTNKSKAKGTAFETDVVKFFRSQNIEAERIPLSGGADQGDIVARIGGLPFVFECKALKALDLATATKEAAIEAQNYAVARHTFLPYFGSIHKRRNYSVASAYVVIPLAEYIRQVSIVPF